MWLEFVSWTNPRSDSSCVTAERVTLGEILLPLGLSSPTCKMDITKSTSGDCCQDETK